MGIEDYVKEGISIKCPQCKENCWKIYYLGNEVDINDETPLPFIFGKFPLFFKCKNCDYWEQLGIKYAKEA